MELYLIGVLFAVILQIIDYLLSKKTKETEEFKILEKVSNNGPLYYTTMTILFIIFSLISWLGVILFTYSIYLQSQRIIKDNKTNANKVK